MFTCLSTRKYNGLYTGKADWAQQDLEDISDQFLPCLEWQGLNCLILKM